MVPLSTFQTLGLLSLLTLLWSSSPQSSPAAACSRLQSSPNDVCPQTYPAAVSSGGVKANALLYPVFSGVVQVDVLLLPVPSEGVSEETFYRGTSKPPHRGSSTPLRGSFKLHCGSLFGRRPSSQRIRACLPPSHKIKACQPPSSHNMVQFSWPSLRHKVQFNLHRSASLCLSTRVSSAGHRLTSFSPPDLTTSW